MNCNTFFVTVFKVVSETEVKVQYFEASDEEQYTDFELVENDMSVIDLNYLVYKLPLPELHFKNRQYLSVFLSIVDVYEN